jgi:hypothetical protein
MTDKNKKELAEVDAIMTRLEKLTDGLENNIERLLQIQMDIEFWQIVSTEFLPSNDKK